MCLLINSATMLVSPVLHFNEKKKEKKKPLPLTGMENWQCFMVSDIQPLNTTVQGRIYYCLNTKELWYVCEEC